MGLQLQISSVPIWRDTRAEACSRCLRFFHFLPAAAAAVLEAAGSPRCRTMSSASLDVSKQHASASLCMTALGCCRWCHQADGGVCTPSDYGLFPASCITCRKVCAPVGLQLPARQWSACDWRSSAGRRLCRCQHTFDGHPFICTATQVSPLDHMRESVAQKQRVANACHFSSRASACQLP